MGYSTILDILASIVMGGILLTIVSRLSDSNAEKTYNYSSELSLQQNLTTVAQVIEYDFRKMGYCKNWLNFPDPSKAIAQADSSSIKFYTDVNNDGNIDSIRYYLGPTSELSGTPNPRDRILYRIVNTNDTTELSLGITQFYLIYFDALGDTVPLPISNPGIISSYEINVRVESVYAYDEQYSSAYWRQIRLVARNLKNR
ncbi:MAG: hypothetical protein ACUVRG_11655 [Ignavibacterium sp.]|uniref:hypothetical protein n=1 Tax=Ignavibacterium sp. TaxID=2651167 RepID=UPI00404A6C58